jgi:hypothetical protein
LAPAAAAAPKQHAEMQQSAPATQQSAGAALSWAALAAQQALLVGAFADTAVCAPTVQHSTHTSQQAGHGTEQHDALASSQHPPESATGQDAARSQWCDVECR